MIAHQLRIALCFVLALTAAGIIAFAPRVEAAPPADPEVVPCEPINSAGLIIIYRCEPDEGMPYKINSLGFMLPED